MSVISDFKSIFTEDNLKKIYNNNIVLSNATGIDALSHRAYWPMLPDQVSAIAKKIGNNTYQFTKYKLKLISKGRGRSPREISIPTIRDRITLRGLCDFLSIRYKGIINFDLPQDMVKKIKLNIESGLYDSFIKLDVENFYPTIRHNELLKRLRRRIRHPQILSIFEKALQTPTIYKSLAADLPNTKGIPQGLSISNILATIYLLNIDSKFSCLADIMYLRYVDDILILCRQQDSDAIAKDFISSCRKIGLKIHAPAPTGSKSRIGSIGSPFGYLGYHFEGSEVTVRDESVLKFRDSIVNIFTAHKHAKRKNLAFLEWRLNLRITGCIFDNKCKGWLFFFSEINDENLLHRLDHYINLIKRRFGITVKTKNLVRAFYQIKHNKYQTSYIPNFDNYDLDQKKHVLKDVFSRDVASLRDEDIEFEFRKKIDRQVRDLLTDIRDFGY